MPEDGDGSAHHGEKAKRGPTLPGIAESLLAEPTTLDFLQFSSMKNVLQSSRVVRDNLSSLVTVEISCMIALAEPKQWRVDLSSRLKLSAARHWRVRNFYVENGNAPFDRQNMKRILYNVMPILGWPNATVLIRIHDSALASEPPLAEPPSPNRTGRTGRTVPGGDSAEPPEPPVKYTAAGLGLVTSIMYKSVKSLPSPLFRLYHDWAEACNSEDGFADALTAYAVPGAAEAYTQMNATSFKTVNHLICDLTQVVACTVAMPLITRLKVYCHNFALDWVTKLAQTFPNAQRVHLVTGRELPSLCEQTEFAATPDFAISLRPPARFPDGKVHGPGPSGPDGYMSHFSIKAVASHLYVMPTSWGTFFRGVQRLQMSELATYFEGVEYMMELFSKEVPQLRRLGTVGEFCLPHLTLLHEDKYLEELVIAVDMEKLHVVFSEFRKIMMAKRRCTIKRFAVHLLCMDGLVRVPADIEQAVLCGWHACGTSLIDASGFICFSLENIKQLETAILQYPWVYPQWFCYDGREYTTAKLCDGGAANKDALPRLPRSTPLHLSLPYTEVTRPKPAGTLAENLDWLPSAQPEPAPKKPISVEGPARKSVGVRKSVGANLLGQAKGHVEHKTQQSWTEMTLFEAIQVLETFYAV